MGSWPQPPGVWPFHLDPVPRQVLHELFGLEIPTFDLRRIIRGVADGRFTSSGGAALGFEVETDGAAVVYSERNPRHDLCRFTPVGGDRLVLEAWSTRQEFEAGKPLLSFGIAHRVK